MRRKPPPPAAEMPARLRVLPVDDDYAAWLAARREWAVEHGVSPLDVLREARQMRRGEAASGGSAPGHPRADES